MFDPRDYLEFAKELITRDFANDEAATRSIISRAYYSAFLGARQELERGLPNQIYRPLFATIKKKPDVHKLVIDLIEVIDAHARSLFIELRSRRNESDYDTEKTVPKEKAEDAILMADELFSKNIPSFLTKMTSKIKEVGQIIIESAHKLQGSS